MSNTYTTGTGQRIVGVHDKSLACEVFGCAVHSPSDHHMKDWPTHWRDDRSFMERICPHGIGHPDPDQIAYIFRTRGIDAARAEGIHGCDGCCALEAKR